MKTQYLIFIISSLMMLLNVYSCKSQYTKWENNKTISNIEFEKIRYKLDKKDTLLMVGYLKKETEIEGYSCAADLVHFTKKIKLQLCKLAKPLKLENELIEKDNWISLENFGYIITWLQKETAIQGHLCMAGKGHEGPSIKFDQKGNLRSFFSPVDIKIDNVFCTGGKSNEIGLLKNGKLEFCTLSVDHNFNDVKYKAGTIIYFDYNGNVSMSKEKK